MGKQSSKSKGGRRCHRDPVTQRARSRQHRPTPTSLVWRRQAHSTTDGKDRDPPPRRTPPGRAPNRSTPPPTHPPTRLRGAAPRRWQGVAAQRTRPNRIMSTPGAASATVTRPRICPFRPPGGVVAVVQAQAGTAGGGEVCGASDTDSARKGLLAKDVSSCRGPPSRDAAEPATPHASPVSGGRAPKLSYLRSPPPRPRATGSATKPLIAASSHLLLTMSAARPARFPPHPTGIPADGV